MKSEKLQDAIGMIKDEMIEEAQVEALFAEAQGEAEEAGESAEVEAPKTADSAEGEAPSTWSMGNTYKGNSWTMLAMNPARREKIKQGKGINSYTTQKISVAVACVILALVVVIPGFSKFMAKNDMKTEYSSEITEEAMPSEGDYKGDESSGASSEGDMVEGYSYESAAADSAASGDAASPGESVGPTEGYGEEKEEAFHMEPAPDQIQGQAFRLTAAEWKDNDNWPFFTNLISSGLIDFPSYGMDPRYRIKVNVMDDASMPLRDEEIKLYDQAGNLLWSAKSNKEGVAYLFFNDGATPKRLESGNDFLDIDIAIPDGSGQGNVSVSLFDDLDMVIHKAAPEVSGTQVMFIVDTTGSMADELAYLQKDFAAIAEDTYDEGIEFSANFYRDEGDEYITRTNAFTKNLASVQNQLNGEIATGGGDHPEAVADILMETIVENKDWDPTKNKVAFLIFDAPPHEGTEQQVQQAVASAAEQGIHLVPVVASNADRSTELFGRALAIMTDGTYVFLTDDSGIGNSHLEPIVGDYQVELLHDVIVRIINSYK